MKNTDFISNKLNQDAPDAIYFLVISGWRNEMQGNRWHWAKRWGQQIPAIIVEPETKGDEFDAHVENVEELENVRILSTRMIAFNKDNLAEYSALQYAQILADCDEHGYKNPWAWLTNPFLSLPYSMLPFKKKIMHFSEDWFRWEDQLNMLWKQSRVALTNSDLVISVSSGCEESAIEQASISTSMVITNGCDTSDYANASVDQSIKEKGKHYLKIAVFGGNIGKCIDYSLLQKLAIKFPNVLFVIVGPQHKLPTDEENALRDEVFAAGNVLWHDRMLPKDLASVYKAAHIGIIPFKYDDYLVESAFPLKLFEMMAAGLPVLATKMKPVVKLNSKWITSTNSDSGFLTEFEHIDKRNISSAEADDLFKFAKNNDYDIKFEEALATISKLHHNSDYDNSSLNIAVLQELITEDEAKELEDFKLPYLNRPHILNHKVKSDDRKITVSILSVSNNISSLILNARELTTKALAVKSTK